jgi:hypothetical protein
MSESEAASGPEPEAELVEETGLAVVTKGDRIYPSRGSLAAISPIAPTAVTYYFPVEIEVVGVGDLAEQIFDALRLQFEALG